MKVNSNAKLYLGLRDTYQEKVLKARAEIFELEQQMVGAIEDDEFMILEEAQNALIGERDRYIETIEKYNEILRRERKADPKGYAAALDVVTERIARKSAPPVLVSWEEMNITAADLDRLARLSK